MQAGPRFYFQSTTRNGTAPGYCLHPNTLFKGFISFIRIFAALLVVINVISF